MYKIYEKEYKAFIESIYSKQAVFGDFFGGKIEALDGVAENETAFYIKTSNKPLTIGRYDKGANVAFEDGTNNSSRFGKRKELKYVTTPVKYTWDWAFDVGIDKHTVNHNLEDALADTLEDEAIELNQLFDEHAGKFISENAGKTLELVDYSADSVLNLFNKLSATFTNLGVRGGHRIAWVNTGLYNAIVDHPESTTDKNSSVNIDENAIVRFKGFTIRETADHKFVDGANEVAYVSIEGIAKQFTGITETRTIVPEGSSGIAVQGSGLAGEHILEANKAAVIKVVEVKAVGESKVDPEGEVDPEL